MIINYNFQQWISWFSHRWRTQRSAIGIVNCRIVNHRIFERTLHPLVFRWVYLFERHFILLLGFGMNISCWIIMVWLPDYNVIDISLDVTGIAHLKTLYRPQIKQDYPLNLSISISGGKETNRDCLSNGEWSGKSSNLKSGSFWGPSCNLKMVFWCWCRHMSLGTGRHRGWDSRFAW